MDMGYVFLVLGTILTLVFIVFLLKGAKYEYMLESLSGDDFPLKTIYVAGLAMQDVKLFRLRGAIGNKIRKDTALVYSKQYSEFYARIIWAQILSFVLLALAIFLVLAGCFSDSMSGFYSLVGVVVAAIFGYYFFIHTGEKVQTRQSECEREFPNAISKLALIVNSGVILHDAWGIVADGNDGVFYDLMKESCIQMENGKSDIDAIYEFGVLTNSDDIRKFTSALIQSIERGGGNLPMFLANQSSELWIRRKQIMLQKGETAASALLMPISLMLVGVMLIVISAAMQSFSL